MAAGDRLSPIGAYRESIAEASSRRHHRSRHTFPSDANFSYEDALRQTLLLPLDRIYRCCHPMVLNRAASRSKRLSAVVLRRVKVSNLDDCYAEQQAPDTPSSMRWNCCRDYVSRALSTRYVKYLS